MDTTRKYSTGRSFSTCGAARTRTHQATGFSRARLQARASLFELHWQALLTQGKQTGERRSVCCILRPAQAQQSAV